MDKAKEKEYEVTGRPKLISCVGIVRISIGNGKQTSQGMFKEIDAENDEIVYQRDLIVYLKCLNEEPLEDRKVKFYQRTS